MGEFPQTTEAKLQKIYEDIKLPKRATAGSAGYDFYTPETFSLKSGETIKIPTGICVEMEEGWVLKLYLAAAWDSNTACSWTTVSES